METVVLVSYQYGIVTEYKADFYSYGKPLNASIFNHEGLEKVRHEGEDYLLMFDSYKNALKFFNYADSIGFDVSL